MTLEGVRTQLPLARLDAITRRDMVDSVVVLSFLSLVLFAQRLLVGSWA